MTDTTPTMQGLPEGTPLGLPNCGVIGVAMLAHAPYKLVHEQFMSLDDDDGYYKKPDWQGFTSHEARMKVLDKLGIKHSTVTTEGPHLKVSELAATLGKLPSSKGVEFMIHTPCHVMTLRDGILYDQYQIAPVAEHRANGEWVVSVTKAVPK